MKTGIAVFLVSLLLSLLSVTLAVTQVQSAINPPETGNEVPLPVSSEGSPIKDGADTLTKDTAQVLTQGNSQPSTEDNTSQATAKNEDLGLPEADQVPESSANLAEGEQPNPKSEEAHLRTNTKEINDKVNKGGHKWKSKAYPKFKDKELKDLAKSCGTKLEWAYPDKIVNDDGTIGASFLETEQTVPESYNFSQVWANCTTPVRDQGECGCCWAFSSAGPLGDRYCVLNKGIRRYIFSPQNLVNCDINNGGCNGGYLDKAWIFLNNTGVHNETCIPYSQDSYLRSLVGQCPTTCLDNALFNKVYKATSIRRFTTIDSAKLDIMKRGPIQGGMMVYEDFFTYETGIYSYVTGAKIGGHAITMVGWGVENGINYWIVKNSWGADWGELGYFRIKEGEVSTSSYLYTGNALSVSYQPMLIEKTPKEVQ